jgi:hypothetical protein
VRAGDQVFILCTVYEADEESFTMMVSATVFCHGEQVSQVTQSDILVRTNQ